MKDWIDISTEENKIYIYNLFMSFSKKSDIYKYFGKHDTRENILYVNNIASLIGFDLSIYKQRKKKYCLHCGKELVIGQKKFCSRSCSSSYNNSHRVLSNETKYKIQRGVLYSLKCRNRLKKEKISKPIVFACGSEDLDKLHPDISSHKKDWFNKFIPFGFNIDSFGTSAIINEFDKCKIILKEEYEVNGLSPRDIYLKYNCKDYFNNFESLLPIFKSWGFKTRDLKESIKQGVINGRINPPKNSNIYKHGWHTTWDNKQVYYRSSYELDHAKQLDLLKINYQMETLRIIYYDTITKEERISIPDFYLPDTNEIIEIKSNYTLNVQNMKDKFKSYIKLGYKPKLLVNHIEVDINTL